MRKRRNTVLTVLVGIAAALVLAAPGAQAFKPFTHNYTGTQARADAIDGTITIAGRSYTVPPQVSQALHDWPTYYNAGVVGPDGFPDLTMGQSIIHPVHTGQWLRYVLDRAWAAQNDPSYTGIEKSQILAFAYGFLTHAAGDMFAHTLVNEGAKGVFPGVGEILTHKTDAEIAIRHLILEGYVGNATPGYDANDDRSQLANGDFSDDASGAIGYDAPIRWIYQTLVDPNAAGAPSHERGPLIGFFVDLRGSLTDFISGSFATDLQAAADSFEDSKAKLDELEDDCAFDPLPNVPACLLDLLEFGFDVAADAIEATVHLVEGVVKEAARFLLAGYIHAWIDDIDAGLQDWGELGLQSTRALFDPQARRDVQNDECGSKGADGLTGLRANCEDAIGATDVLFELTNDFVNDHLLSMLGAPDFVGVARGAIQDAMDELGKALDVVLNPIAEPLSAIKDFAKDQIKELVSEAIGVDVEELDDFVSHPTNWLNVQSASLSLPGLGTVTLDLFQDGQHAKLDEYMHLPADHHEGLDPSTELRDDVKFDPNTFAAVKNTITMAKLLLLDSGELNRALTDILRDQGYIKQTAQVNTYPAGADVMWYPLHDKAVDADPNTPGTAPGTLTSEPWLQLIDGDHAWRANGLPKFCNSSFPQTCATVPGALSRQASGSGGESQKDAGNGEFPIWESCVLRPAFRVLYTDWENGAQNFPDLGDATSSDTRTDPNAPTVAVGATANSYTNAGITYVGKANQLRVSASDDVFTDGHVTPAYVLYKAGTLHGAPSASANPASFSIPADGGDGQWNVDATGTDPCATSAVTTTSFVLDTTAPTITAAISPAGPMFDTASTTTLTFSADDGLGSGVKTLTATLDGSPTTTGAVIDTFFLDAGTHTIVVSSEDNVGNASSKTIVFEVHATAESLGKNLDRAFSLGLISKQGIYNSLSAKIDQALKKHLAGQHAVEWNLLGAFVNELRAQSGKAVDPATATRFIGYANDLIARAG